MAEINTFAKNSIQIFMITRNTYWFTAIQLTIIFFLGACSSNSIPSLNEFEFNNKKFALTSSTTSPRTGLIDLQLVDIETKKPIPFSISDPKNSSFLVGINSSKESHFIVAPEGGDVSFTINTSETTFNAQFDVATFRYKNVFPITSPDETSNVFVVLNNPRYPVYGIQPITFLVVEKQDEVWQISDNWKINFTPWMNMGQKGHGSQFNEQPVSFDSLGKPWQKGKVSFSMTGEWDLRLKLAHKTENLVLTDTLILDVLDEEELEVILHTLPLLRR